MLFNSLHFLLFLPVVVLCYYILAPKFRWILIFIASCYFYMAFVPEYILILFSIIIIDYSAALAIERAKNKRKLFYLVMSLSANILLLGFFKYFNFFNDNLATLFSCFGSDLHPLNLNILLPIGLSFHTFQSMGYTIEVYKGRQVAERHLGYFANYVLFFPQMVAGPIERYQTLGAELKKPQKASYENFSNGFRLILFGLFIKMAIADNIAPFVNDIYLDPLKHNSLEVLAAVFLFSIQIYADFFGYSTIALGAARLLGIHIMDNFKTPYLSKSISEFWSRWHISLSTWFRDYLYIPLGGNRVTIKRWTFNIMLVFMVSGLWHGASWTFVVWGMLHGTMLLLERYLSRAFNFKIKEGWSLINTLLTIKTFVLTSFIWIFFRAENFKNARQVIQAIFKNYLLIPSFNQLFLPLFFTAVLITFDFLLYNSRFDIEVAKLGGSYRWATYAMIIFLLFALSGTQKFTFIYFQF